MLFTPLLDSSGAADVFNRANQTMECIDRCAVLRTPQTTDTCLSCGIV